MDLDTFMKQHRLTVQDVAKITSRKVKTVYGWRSNRVPPDWVIPLLEAYCNRLDSM